MSKNINWIGKFVIINYYGIITLEEFAQIEDEASMDRRFNMITGLIADLTKVEKILIDDQKIRKLAHHTKSVTSWNKQVKLAICNGGKFEDFLTEYIKHIKSLKMPWKVELFNDLKSAKDWVGMINHKTA